MSEDEDTAVLLNNGIHKVAEPSTIRPTSLQEYQFNIPPKMFTKPLLRKSESSALLVPKNQHFLLPIVAILAGISFGYDMGIGKQIAPAVKDTFEIDCHEENIIVNVWFVGCLFGAVLGGILIDSCGRRWTMIFSLGFLIFGSALSSFSNHYILFLIARIMCGYAGTISAMSQCIYMAEASDSDKRGCNIMLHQIGSAVGLFFAVIMAVKKNEDQWRYAIIITALPAFIACFIIILFLQRSPSFLLLKRITNVPKIPVKTSYRYVVETLVVMVLMIVLRQATGRLQVLYYAPRLFALLGICSNVAKVTATISLGIVRVFSTILCLIILEKCGRRTALITSATICMTSISLLSLLSSLDKGDELLNFPNEPCPVAKPILSTSQFLNKPKYISPTGSPPPYPLLPTPLALQVPSTETWTQVKSSCEMQNVISSDGLSGGLQILAVITLLVFESAYALGLGPVPLLTLSEVFPATIRGKCIGFCAVILWVTHILFYEYIGRMTRFMTLAGTYLFYSFMCLVSIIYVFLTYPETKGRTLNRVAQELRKMSLLNRICNNIKSLPLVCHISWILEKASQTTPI